MAYTGPCGTVYIHPLEQMNASCTFHAMPDLQSWMNEHGETDGTLAPKVSLSRVQVSRIRRRKSGVSPEAAKRIEAVTAIPAADLIFGDAA